MERVLPEAHLRDHFEALSASAVRCAPAFEEAHFVFGGHHVRLRTAGRRLTPLIRTPFAHLRCSRPPAGPVRLDVSLWDAQEAGVPVPPTGSEAVDVDGLTEVADTGRFLRQQKPWSVVSLDRRTGRLVGAFALPDRVGTYDRGKPLARLLTEWYADQGVSVVHAGLVTRDGHGVLLAGKGGSGKSTSALACARAGLGFLGEDYAALEFGEDGTVVGHSAYNSVFLDPRAAAWFPELRPSLQVDDGEAEAKGVVLLADVWPSRLVARAPLRAVALCRVTDIGVSRVRKASRAEALLAMGPSSLLEIHGRRRDSLDRIARLVEGVPCFHLDLGRSLASVPRAIEEVLDGARNA